MSVGKLAATELRAIGIGWVMLHVPLNLQRTTFPLYTRARHTKIVRGALLAKWLQIVCADVVTFATVQGAGLLPWWWLVLQPVDCIGYVQLIYVDRIPQICICSRCKLIHILQNSKLTEEVPLKWLHHRFALL